MDIVNTVAARTERIKLDLSEAEVAGIVALVRETGSLAPQDEVIAQFKAGALTPGMLTYFTPWLWKSKLDTCTVETEVWRTMFQEAEYTQDTVVTTPPKRTIRAYRGATEKNREGLAWTLEVDQAKYLARYRQAPEANTARVWATKIPPERMLACFTEGWEKEIVADVRGLDIRPVEEADLLPRIRMRPWWSWIAPSS